MSDVALRRGEALADGVALAEPQHARGILAGRARVAGRLVDQPDVADAALALDRALDPLDRAVGRVAVHEQDLGVPPELRHALDGVVDVAFLVAAGNHDRDARGVDRTGVCLAARFAIAYWTRQRCRSPGTWGAAALSAADRSGIRTGTSSACPESSSSKPERPQEVLEVLSPEPVLIGLGHLRPEPLRQAEKPLPQEVVVRDDEAGPVVEEPAPIPRSAA